MWILFTTALTLGLVSSLHCAGMCGPLVMALPIQHLPRIARTGALLSYHAGRLLIYASLGALSGLLGRHLYLAGFQQAFSIILGSLILLSMVIRFSAANLFTPLQDLIIRLWRRPRRYGYLLLGMSNGLLPCGMVYLAVAGALSLPMVGDSILFMLFFGAGTLPMLLIIGYAGRLIGAEARSYMKKATPYMVALMGILLILRGLDLGIPFISPVMAHAPGQGISCH